MMTMKRLLRSLTALTIAAAVAGCGGLAEKQEASYGDKAPIAPSAGSGGKVVNPDLPVSSPAVGVQDPPAPGTAPTNAPQQDPGDIPAQGGGSSGSPGAVNPTKPASPPAQVSPPSQGTPPPPQTADQALSITPLERGAYSGVTEPGAVLITGEAGWKAHWQQHAGRIVPTPAAPSVDFSRDSILTVYMGEQNSGGHSIEITGVKLAGGTLKVQVKETRPGPNAMVTMALTQPYHMVKIPKVPEGTPVEIIR